MATQVGYGAVACTSPPDASSQWYFGDDDLANTPSQVGSDCSASPYAKTLTGADEQDRRMRGCNFIHNVVQRLKMHQFVASTGCVLFHRFYMRQSLDVYHHYQIAGACVLLASKIEENKRGFKEIALACSLVAAKGDAQDASRNQETWERLLPRQEIALLENCCFDLEITHPYRYIDLLAHEFAIPVFIAKAATAHVNDTLRSTVCLRFRPEITAAAALCLAMAIHRYDVKADLLDSRFVNLPPAAESEIEACVLQMLAFYRREADSEREIARHQQQQLRPPIHQQHQQQLHPRT